MLDHEIVQTVAAILSAGTTWTWGPTTAYTSSDVGIFYGPVMESVDAGVGITLYADASELVTGLRVVRVQLRFRGAPGVRYGADAMAAAAADVLDGLTRTSGLAQVRRLMVGTLGYDEHERQERADSYQVIIDND